MIVAIIGFVFCMLMIGAVACMKLYVDLSR